MIAVLLVVVLCCAASGAIMLLARPLVDRAPPATAVPLLAIGSLISAASLSLLLTLLGLAVIGRVPIVASAAGWSTDRLKNAIPVPTLVGISAGVLVVVLLGRTVLRRAGWWFCYFDRIGSVAASGRVVLPL